MNTQTRPTREAIANQIIDNADRTGHGSHVAAFASTLLGVPAVSVCVWCSENVEGPAVRLRAGGECSKCPTVGRDVLIVFPDGGNA